MRRYVIALLATASFLFVNDGYAAAPVQQSAKNVPTNITSNKMTYNADAQTVIFTGNVHVTRPDYQLWSEKVTVFLDKAKEKSSDESTVGGMSAGDVSRIVAEKKVVIKSEDKEARANKATYEVRTETFKLEGPPQPWLRKGKDLITGNIIYHYMKDNRSEVVGGATANFFAPDRTQPQPK